MSFRPFQSQIAEVEATPSTSLNDYQYQYTTLRDQPIPGSGQKHELDPSIVDLLLDNHISQFKQEHMVQTNQDSQGVFFLQDNTNSYIDLDNPEGQQPQVNSTWITSYPEMENDTIKDKLIQNLDGQPNFGSTGSTFGLGRSRSDEISDSPEAQKMQARRMYARQKNIPVSSLSSIQLNDTILLPYHFLNYGEAR